ncbi:MAG: SUMF1/EgtB/PvdO family nonheme iron enzyme, partial [Planctomycetaceae bacterium]|nr:SUMF1/EgtB/PvdO family nonheme iron enzyme [Planctomycetaceae bacterium]
MTETDQNPTSGDEQLDKLIAQYLEEVDASGKVDHDQFMAEHPEYADALGKYFQDVAVVERLAESNEGWVANTIIDNSGTNAPGISEPVEPAQTVTRGAADSETSIKPPNVNKSSASITETFGRYNILKTLGEGAMGAVYLAHDTQLDRQVALKIPKFDDDPGGEMLERFYREARSAAMLRSPNICPVFDVGEIDGQHYITMAYIEGRTLKDFTASRKQHSEKQIAVVIRKLATGLAEAHAQGVIHRDLKPANIMIDGKGEPVVMDFGLARRNASSEVQVTHSGAILGTPAYMSPEQVEGEQSEIGQQTDVYALGVIMYELITGRMPFQGTLMSILKQIAIDEPQPPSELRDDLDSAIDIICLKMMAKQKAARYQSMEEVSRELGNYLKNPSKKKATRKKDNVAKELPAQESIATGSEESNPALRTAPPVEIVVKPPKPKVAKPAKKALRPRPKAGRHLPRNRKRNRHIAIAVSVVAALGLIYGAVTFFIRVGDVDVKVVIDDPTLSVKFEGQTVTFEMADKGTPLKLSPGGHQFTIEQDGLKAKTDEFTVTKDGKNILHVAIVNGKVAVIPPGKKPPAVASGAGNAPGTTPKVNTHGSANVPPPAVAPFDAAQAKTHQQAWAESLGIKLEETNSIGMKFRIIPPGEFQMGSTAAEIKQLVDGTELGVWKERYRSEGPRHRVRLTKPFFLGVHEVTQEQYEKVMEKNPSSFSATGPLTGRVVGLDTRRHPVETVSWYDAVAFCNKLSLREGLNPCYSVTGSAVTLLPTGNGYRLPTEAEWEFTCRAGTETRWWCGDEESSLQRVAWHEGNRTQRAHRTYPVGEKIANGFGLFDIHGNVWEWCWDRFHPSYYENSPMENPAGPLQVSKRVLRGGGFCVSGGSHSAYRNSNPPNLRDGCIGFRVVRVIPVTADSKPKKVSETPMGKTLPKVLPAEIESVAVIWDGAPHSAFTDLIRFKDRWICVFREGGSPSSYDGKLRIISSNDGQSWESAALLESPGKDLRDPKLSRMPDGRLMLSAAERQQGGDTSEQTLAWNSTDGRQWSKAADLGEPNWRLWRITWRNGMGYSLAYSGKSSATTVRLFRGKDPTTFRPDVQDLGVVGGPSEASLLFLPDNTLLALVRRGAATKTATLGTSSPPYETWAWKDLDQELAGPNLIRLADGRLVVGARLAKPARTSLCWLDAEKGTLTEFLLLPSGGSSGYPGLVEHEGMLWVSYYSSHEGKAKVYLAKVKVPDISTIGQSPAPAVAPFGAKQGKTHQEAWAKHLGTEVETTNSIGMKLRVIPPGEFQMGSNKEEIERLVTDKTVAIDEAWISRYRSEGPQHKVTLTKPVLMSVHEVTRGQFRKFVEETGYKTDAEKDGKGGVGFKDGRVVQAPQFIWSADIGFGQTDEHPVINVIWNDATAFCACLSRKEGVKYHLPTEAEWEFACRAGTTSRYSFGDDEKLLESYAWSGIKTREGGRPHPVGQKQANGFGLFDMHGNVKEWCQDRWGLYTQNSLVDPAGPADGNRSVFRVWRGGSYEDRSSETRSAFRYPNVPQTRRAYNIGFRVVRDVAKQSKPPVAKAPFDAATAKKHQQAWADYLGVPVEKVLDIGGGVKVTMVLIPPGEFLMGTTDEEQARWLKVATAVKEQPTIDFLPSEGPQHRVRLTKPFYLAVHEVTQEQYQQVTGTNPSHFSSSGDGKGRVVGQLTNRRPVENVSWLGAVSFCNKLSVLEKQRSCYVISGNSVTRLPGNGYRLPTEAEWEYACRAGSTGTFCIADESELGNYAWYTKNSGGMPHPVGEKLPNGFGAFDMHGNVWEWCWDWYEAKHYSQRKGGGDVLDPFGPSAGMQRVYRGGGWVNFALNCRSAYRYCSGQNIHGSGLGFRIAMTIDVAKLKTAQEPPTEPAAAIAPFNAEQAEEHPTAWAKHLGVPVETTNSIGMKQQVTPPDEFLLGGSEKENRRQPGPLLFVTARAQGPQKQKRRNASPTSKNDRKGNRVASMSSRERDRALADLPDINSFRGRKSDRFLVDLDVVRTGHPYKGKNAKRPHTGGHIYFKAPARQLSAADVKSYPAIYAVADGVISRIDYSFRLREMFERALNRRVANTRYGIGLTFATRDGRPVDMHYSI